MDKLHCKICGTKHWPREGHKFTRTDAVATTGGKATVETVVEDTGLGEQSQDRPVKVSPESAPVNSKKAVGGEKPPANDLVCPTCGKRMGRTGAERMRLYRARKT